MVDALPDDLAPETLDFIFEHVKDAPQPKFETVDSLDAKVFSLLGAAAVVIGLAGLGRDAGATTGVGVLLVLGIASFVVGAGAAVVALWTRAYRLSFQADALWREHWTEPVPVVKYTLVADIATAYAHNSALLERKSRAVRTLLVAVAAEVVFVGLSLAWPHLT